MFSSDDKEEVEEETKKEVTSVSTKTNTDRKTQPTKLVDLGAAANLGSQSVPSQQTNDTSLEEIFGNFSSSSGQQQQPQQPKQDILSGKLGIQMAFRDTIICTQETYK